MVTTQRVVNICLKSRLLADSVSHILRQEGLPVACRRTPVGTLLAPSDVLITDPDRLPPEAALGLPPATTIVLHDGETSGSRRYPDFVRHVSGSGGIRALLAEVHSGPRRTDRARQLTPRQVQVLRQVARGATNTEIADALFLSVGTVKRHLHEIYRALTVSSRLEAVRVSGLLVEGGLYDADGERRIASQSAQHRHGGATQLTT